MLMSGLLVLAVGVIAYANDVVTTKASMGQ
jgi:hypothetical protein